MTLNYDLPAPILLARDRPAKMMLLGGLGSLGVGTMWFTDDHDAARRFENWETAPEEKADAAYCQCTASSPLIENPWPDKPHASWRRCWLKPGHGMPHSIGSNPNLITWVEGRELP